MLVKTLFSFVPEFLRKTRHLRQRFRHLGRREPGAVLQDVDVRGHAGNSALLTCGAYIPETVPLQVAIGGERVEAQLGAVGGSVAGRLRQVLLPEDRQRQGRLRRRGLEAILEDPPGLQELQVVPGQHISRAVHSRRGRC